MLGYKLCFIYTFHYHSVVDGNQGVTGTSERLTLACCDLPRLSRGRINDVFGLSDQTLEFIGIVPTLAPPYEQPVPVWLIVFGVVMGLVVLAAIYLVISGIRERKKWVCSLDDRTTSAVQATLNCETPSVSRQPREAENPYEDTTGVSNKAFEDSDDEQTGF